jgi:large subunit ribosomal protein L23
MHVYEVIRRPILTEKTNIAIGDDNQYTFEVDMRANKMQIKDAVETVFNVDVENVRILVMPAKTAQRGRRTVIRKPKWKKAVVTLSPDSQIDLYGGV